MPSFEVLLPVGAIGFYLFDASVLLYGNELALERDGRGWASSGGFGMQIAGRRLFIPNPLRPDALLFRTRWDSNDARTAASPFDVAAFREEMGPLRLCALGQGLLLFLALPPVSAILGAGNLLLAVFATYYLLTLVALGVLFRRRQPLQVSIKQFAWLAAESLLCAPFAINLVRKVSLARSGNLDWLEIAAAEFSLDVKRSAIAAIEARIGERLAVEEEGSAAALRLESVRAALKERLDVRVLA